MLANRDHYNAYQRAQSKAHPERRKARDTKYNAHLRDQVFDLFGGTCACCGQAEKVFLTIDHPNRDGKQHRASLKEEGSVSRGGSEFYRYLWREHLADRPLDVELQLLCWNCHMAKDFRGGCPHQLLGDDEGIDNERSELTVLGKLGYTSA